MKQAKHTPGNWQVLPEECDKPYIRIRGTVLGGRFKIANVLTPVYDNVHAREAEETRANAKLIAAAPELLDANIQLVEQVKQLLDQIEKVQRGEWKPTSFCTSAARAVAADARETIAKATGGAA